MRSFVDGVEGFVCMLQVPMVPIPKADELRLGGYAPAQRMQQAYYETSLYGDSEKGVATMIAWSHGGAQVGVIGSWDNWQTRCGSLFANL